MEKGKKVNGKYVRPIYRGLEFKIHLRADAGYFDQFTTIQADFKATPSLNDPALYTFNLASGIVRSGNYIVITIPESVTAIIQEDELHTDIKGRIGAGAPVVFVTGIFPIKESISNPPIPVI